MPLDTNTSVVNENKEALVHRARQSLLSNYPFYLATFYKANEATITDKEQLRIALAQTQIFDELDKFFHKNKWENDGYIFEIPFLIQTLLELLKDNRTIQEFLLNGMNYYSYEIDPFDTENTITNFLKTRLDFCAWLIQMNTHEALITFRNANSEKFKLQPREAVALQYQLTQQLESIAENFIGFQTGVRYSYFLDKATQGVLAHKIGIDSIYFLFLQKNDGNKAISLLEKIINQDIHTLLKLISTLQTLLDYEINKGDVLHSLCIINLLFFHEQKLGKNIIAQIIKYSNTDEYNPSLLLNTVSIFIRTLSMYSQQVSNPKNAETMMYLLLNHSIVHNSKSTTLKDCLTSIDNSVLSKKEISEKNKLVFLLNDQEDELAEIFSLMTPLNS